MKTITVNIDDDNSGTLHLHLITAGNINGTETFAVAAALLTAIGNGAGLETEEVIARLRPHLASTTERNSK